MQDIEVQKPDSQFNIIGLLIKSGLILMLLTIQRSELSLSFFHFISLYGTLCFIVICFLEYRRKNYILTLLSIICMIAYQPIYSVLKIDVAYGYVDINSIVVQTTSITTITWIIADVVRWIRDARRFKKMKSTL